MEIFGISLIALCGLAVALSTAIIAGAMFILGKERTHYLWGVFCLAVCVWSGCFFIIGQTHDPATALYWWRISHIGVIFIPITFFHYVLEFIKKRERVIIPLYVLGILFAIVDFYTPFLIADVRFAFSQLYYDTPGIIYPELTLTFAALILYAHYLVYRAYRGSNDQLFRAQARYFFLATSIGFAGGTLSFLPVFGIDVYPATIITVAAAPPLIGFAILRYRLFDIKVVAAQFLTLILAVFSFMRLLFATTTQEFSLNAALFLLTIGVGVYLIRSVRLEVEQREQIEKLSDEKSEFMTFASHEIRNPITAMRGYASLITDGTTGEVAPQTKDVAEKILVLGDEVLALIGQFLSKSKMELGKIQYSSDIFDLGVAVSIIADGYKPHAQQKGIDLVKKIDPNEHLIVKADQGKVKEVVGNIIDNSLKYTRQGNITVAVERHGISVRVVVSDTGVGIAPETLPHLFKKFSRADAQKVNLLGTGIGLYLAKTFIEAMGGRIWAESEGTDKGSRFIIEFPAAA